jgi:hypothetical protein
MLLDDILDIVAQPFCTRQRVDKLTGWYRLQTPCKGPVQKLCTNPREYQVGELVKVTGVKVTQ